MHGRGVGTFIGFYQRVVLKCDGYLSLLLFDGLSHLSLWPNDHLLLTLVVSSEVLFIILVDTLHILHHLLLLARRQHLVIAFTLAAHIVAVRPSLHLLALGATFFAFLEQSHVKLLQQKTG